MAGYQVHVFRRYGDDMLLIDERTWDAFVRGSLPMPGIGARLDVLIITSRDGTCELADPVSLRLDRHGYLERLDLGLPAMPLDNGVLDARWPFIERYLRHAHRWVPTPGQLAKASTDSLAAQTANTYVGSG